MKLCTVQIKMLKHGWHSSAATVHIRNGTCTLRIQTSVQVLQRSIFYNLSVKNHHFCLSEVVAAEMNQNHLSLFPSLLEETLVCICQGPDNLFNF